MHNRVKKIVRAQVGSHLFLNNDPTSNWNLVSWRPPMDFPYVKPSVSLDPLKSQKEQPIQLNKNPRKPVNFSNLERLDTIRKTLFNNTNNSGTTSGINNLYDATSSSLMAFSPVGTIVGGAMKIGGFVGDALSSMGVGTDQMTTTDQILDSNFMKLTPAGLVNSIWSNNSQEFSVNNDTMELVGTSYLGSAKGINDAASKSNKKYGLFSGKLRKEANAEIDIARGRLSAMTNIAKSAADKIAMSNQSNYLNYNSNLNGGYDLRYMRAAKNGAILTRVKTLLKAKKGMLIYTDWTPIINVELFEKGGKISELTTQKNVIPEGALHARKHNMENAEGLTTKGIPVIDNDLDQLAEIELNEIIFTLEVTKELEKLTADGSDDAAIEAGKLLVLEILFNTDDRTSLINTIK